MTDSLTLRVRALELELASRTKPAAISQVISGRSLTAGVSTAITLSAVPTGKLVSFSIGLPYRFPTGGAHFTNSQMFDGTTQVGNDLIMAASVSGGAQNLSVTLTIGGYVFTAVPTLKLYASTVITLDATKLMGIAWT